MDYNPAPTSKGGPQSFTKRNYALPARDPGNLLGGVECVGEHGTGRVRPTQNVPRQIVIVARLPDAGRR